MTYRIIPRNCIEEYWTSNVASAAKSTEGARKTENLQLHYADVEACHWDWEVPFRLEFSLVAGPEILQRRLIGDERCFQTWAAARGIKIPPITWLSTSISPHIVLNWTEMKNIRHIEFILSYT